MNPLEVGGLGVWLEGEGVRNFEGVSLFLERMGSHQSLGHLGNCFFLVKLFAMIFSGLSKEREFLQIQVVFHENSSIFN